jgi:hypothetical protein
MIIILDPSVGKPPPVEHSLWGINTMKCLTRDQFVETIEAQGIGLGNTLELRPTPFCLLRLPEAVGAQADIVYALKESLAPAATYIIYLTAWNVTSQDGGLVSMVDGFRAHCGEHRPIQSASGHSFSSSEAELAFGLLRIVIAFEWGALLFAQSQDVILYDMFDCYLRMYGQSTSTLISVKERLIELGSVEQEPTLFTRRNVA